ncbi:peptidoglycan-binding protein [Leifsonia shinshuensis]|uniref:Peptidoglycan hydrolase-like protein with peptidoglycan-binding domain n=1 Tax=Leifsonia shinshuensis TaxID=150026 RepID=A0A853CQB6_9MICO|nr:peptidoglycan-binding protein [Leifsonia shinshuensis]NYJ22612.1 peptidoglycan hydrolase-like protein with peptidoglycan-binding domain [Leifsonia shinshuensis]
MRRGERSAVYWTLTTCVLVAAAAVGGGAWTAAHSAPPARTVVPTATATVQSTTLSSTTQLSGTLGHGASRTLFSPAGGTVTGVPAVGSTVADGGALLSVDGLPVVLVDGAVPAWRDLAVGSAPGADVAQLEQYLVSAGFAAGLDLTVDQDYTWATATAVARWQRAVGLPATGVAARSELVFAPAPVRVVAVAAPLGSRISDGQPALEVGSTAAEVTADVPAAQTYLVHAGDRVTVTLPSGQTVPGSVTGVSTVAEAAGSGGGGGGGQQGGPVTVPATVVLDDPAAAAGLDQAPVTVQVTDRTVHDVLAVPITALVALAGGGYGVYVVDRGGRRLVAVTPGLFSGTLVQVGSGSLRAGDRVVIPSS